MIRRPLPAGIRDVRSRPGQPRLGAGVRHGDVQSVERTTVSRPGSPSDCQSRSFVVGTAAPVPAGSGSLVEVVGDVGSEVLGA